MINIESETWPNDKEKTILILGYFNKPFSVIFETKENKDMENVNNMINKLDLIHRAVPKLECTFFWNTKMAPSPNQPHT